MKLFVAEAVICEQPWLIVEPMTNRRVLDPCRNCRPIILAAKVSEKRPTPKRISKSRRGLIDISVLPKSRYGCTLDLSKAVIWRMSAEAADANLRRRLRAP